MIKTMFRRIAPALVLLGSVSPALAGEVGVTNSWSSGWREGHGVSNLKVNSTRHEFGESHTSAFKLELGRLESGSGEFKAAVYNGEPFGFYFAGSQGTDRRHYSETSETSFTEGTRFGFGTSSNSHSVSAFSN
jgi:hypothetical protein